MSFFWAVEWRVFTEPCPERPEGWGAEGQDGVIAATADEAIEKFRKHNPEAFITKVSIEGEVTIGDG